MTAELELVIPGRPPNPNDAHRPGANHWRAQARITEQWRGAARLIAQAGRPAGWHPLGRAIVRVTFVIPRKGRRDLDNLIASTKPLTDGIVDAGILVDDSNEVIVSMAFDWSYRKGEDATIYRISGDAASLELGLDDDAS